ncbi:hypothetical protein BH11PSE4_BH11PSE4_24430 [soil metagenome]
MPEPRRPDRRPDIVQVRLPAAPMPEVEPFGPTRAVPYCPTILSPVTTTVSVELPQGAPTLVRIHAPSKFPPPPVLRDARLGVPDSGLLRGAGLAGCTARGVSREPESDFSRLPRTPPVPPCASAVPGNATTPTVTDNTTTLAKARRAICDTAGFQ